MSTSYRNLASESPAGRGPHARPANLRSHVAPCARASVALSLPKAELSLPEARRLALAAQGFGAAAKARPGRRALAAVVARLGCVQIDSVNVLVRSHFLPFFSRLGAYDTATLDDLLYGKRRAFAEYWAHEASIVGLERWPLLRWRMLRARAGDGMWGNVARVARERPELVDAVRARIRAEGPMAASDFDDAKSLGSWWGWSETKRALEYLFWAGYVTTRRRRTSFEREYDLVERVIPAAYLEADIDGADARRALVLGAVRALGVATEADVRDYYRLDVVDAREALAGLVARGELATIAVENWRAPAYVAPPLRIPRRVAGRALLSPFDNLIWNRPRAARLFDFDFRLEIYTPAARRIHGYYVLPYLIEGRLVARIDLKHDRARSTLVAHAVHLESHADARALATPLRHDLAELAAWLGAARVRLPPRRDWFS